MEDVNLVKVIRTTSGNHEFRKLVQELDDDLMKRNGEAQNQYHQYNKIDHIKHAVLIGFGSRFVGCGCFKRFDDHTVEIKRMFVKPEMRGNQLAARMLQELEKWAMEEGYTNAVLETGIRQVEAQRLYSVAGYVQTQNYGQYLGMSDSLCYRKNLVSSGK